MFFQSQNNNYYAPSVPPLYHSRERKLSHSEKVRIGGTPAMATMEIIEPTDRDKGLYHIQIIDTDKTYTRTIDLSGHGKPDDIDSIYAVVLVL